MSEEELQQQEEDVVDDLLVDFVEISKIEPHQDPEVERLEVVHVKGWKTLTQKGQYQPGDVVLYIPPDSMIPVEWAQKWGVEEYLHFKKNSTFGRVKAIRLRGEMSYGFVVNPKNLVGLNIKDSIGIKKYQEPQKRRGFASGEAEKEHFLFYKYTKIQNTKNYPDFLTPGEEVVASEKLHGTNSRIAFIKTNENFELMIGSNRTRRKLGTESIYEKPLALFPQLMDLFEDLLYQNEELNSIIVFGEIFGSGIQDLEYGKDEITFSAFDICCDHVYLDFDDARNLFQKHQIPMVPLLYEGPFDQKLMEELSSGKTTIMKSKAHIREGIVVKPKIEREVKGLGRVILKFINDDYLLRKKGTEFH